MTTTTRQGECRPSSLASPITRSYACTACDGNGCPCCFGLGETVLTATEPADISETPAGLCECGGCLYDTRRDFRTGEGISGGILRYFECAECDWRECK